MNMIVVFEDQATKQCQESKPYAFASALEVRCLCGNLVHPIPALGARNAARRWWKSGRRGELNGPAFTETLS